MTHGYIWLPFNGKMLFCEAWSDGYLEGVGFGALCSSQKIETITKLSEIFLGSPFFYNPSTDTYTAKEEDYLIDGYEDILEDEGLLADAQKTLEYVLGDNLDDAFNTDFAKLDLDTRMALEIGMNAEIVNNDIAWDRFAHDSIELDLEPLCNLLIKEYQNEGEYFDINECLDTVYYYKDNQFLVNIGMNDDNRYIMPLIIACAFMDMNHTVYGDSAYLQDMTPEDKKALKLLVNCMKMHNVPETILFSGEAYNID